MIAACGGGGIWLLLTACFGYGCVPCCVFELTILGFVGNPCL